MKTLYIVLSRDNGQFVFATHDKEKAETTKKQQTNREEFQGGKPSVYIIETKIR